MARVALFITELGPSAAKCKLALAKSLGISLAEVTASTGDAPLFDRELFGRAEPAFASTLLETLTFLDSQGCRWRAVELLSGEAWDPSKTYYEITLDRLRNLIERYKEIVAEVEMLTDLELGEEPEAERG